MSVLSNRFSVDKVQLEAIWRDRMFAERLFTELLDRKFAHGLLLEIFSGSIPVNVELCEPAKAIIRYVKSWPDKPKDLLMMCAHFMDYEVTPTPTPSQRWLRTL